MTRDQIQSVLLEEIGNIAPEADLAALDPEADLREALDIDSISFLNLLIALGSRLGIQVPEKDYGRLASLRLAVDYLVTGVPKGEA
jgi:acyl carrier protein